MITLPVVVSPVNEISGTSGCSTSAAPGLLADAVDEVEHPGRARRPRSRSPGQRLAESGVNSAGFSTTGQPEASAGASFQLSSMNGVFHGVISPATPTGLRST